MVEVRFYSRELEARWDDFILNSKTPLFFFQRSFLEYHSDRFTDVSLVAFQDGEIVGLIPATRHDRIVVSHGGLTFGGVIVDARARSSIAGVVLSSALSFLAENGFDRLRYKAVPWFLRTLPSEEDLYFIMRQPGGRLARRDLSSIIDLNARLKLSKGRKALLSKARQSGVELRQSEDWQSFYNLLANVLQRHGAKPVHTPAELDYLSSRHPAHVKLFVAVKDEELLAGTILFDFGHVVHTQYLAVSEQGKALGALDFLIETCIEASVESARYFSFGISTEDDGRYLNQGLLNQKEGFGARSAIIDTYEVDTRDFQS